MYMFNSMRRKLVKQGDNALTVTLPASWTKTNKLSPGNEVNIEEEQNNLIIKPAYIMSLPKTIAITITPATFNIYRSLLGSYYRQGYDEIHIMYTNPKIIPELQKAVDFLYGFEVFEQKENICVIKKMYESEPTQIVSFMNKMIQTIKTMQNIVINDLQKNKFTSKEEIYQFRNNILRYRDIISRTIVYYKLLDDKHFPQYTIAMYLWQIARAYNHIYHVVAKQNKLSKQEYELFTEINVFLIELFEKQKEGKHKYFHEKYDILHKKAEQLLTKKNTCYLFINYNLYILMQLQSCNSSLLLLNK